MKLCFVAVGQDYFWLEAIQKATTNLIGEIKTVEISTDLKKNTSQLPTPDTNTVLLVDASNQENIEETVKLLKEQGWKYVIVVAADPSANEATAVLRRNLGYDYWVKTYDIEEIINQVKDIIDEFKKATD